MTLTAQQLLEPDSLETALVSVPEWGRGQDCEVMIRMMDGLAISAFEARMEAAQRDLRDDLGADADDGGKLEAAARAQHAIRRRLMVEYCAASIVDPATGALVYDTPAKIEILAGKRGTGLRKVFNAATALNRDTSEAAESFRKNSAGTGGSGSGSSTPSKKGSDIPSGSCES